MTRAYSGTDGPHADAEPVIAGAPAAAAEVAVVLLHGRGGTAEGIVRLADGFTRSGATLLAPNARRSVWFPAAHDAPRSANEPALTSAIDSVADAVDAAAEIGIGPERVVLVGVSQGGCVAGEFLRRRPRRFGGAFLVSAALPGSTVAASTVEGDLSGTPVELASSERDPYVPVERVRATAAVLGAGGAAVDLRVDGGDGHGLSDATSERIGDRLDVLLSGSSTSGSA
ncbi:alpha/beta hydrolase [Halorubrum sp. DTA98]|uniref:alpha/beta hydrolase n=1 Tax=Halorubrum sp. DTA98 TaxID=3402163 RepID=UPI003AAE0CCA